MERFGASPNGVAIAFSQECTPLISVARPMEEAVIEVPTVANIGLTLMTGMVSPLAATIMIKVLAIARQPAYSVCVKLDSW